MRKTRMQKGITLIALIITIIILLILAVVTIGSMKNSNIITYAQNASTDYEKAKNDEEGIISNYESIIKENLPGENGNAEIGKATVGTKTTKNSTIDGKEYSSTNPIIPAGYAPINITGEHASSWNAEDRPQVSAGLVITDNTTTRDDNGNTIGNEFVWVPVDNINTMVMCQNCIAKTDGINEETLQCKVCGENTKLAGRVNNATTYSETGYREPGVVTKIRNSETNADDKDGTDMDPAYLKKAGLTTDLTGDNKIDEKDFKYQLQKEFNEMVASVAKYGGFYVGRYETSLNGSVAQSKAGQPVMNSRDWYIMYKYSETYSQRGVVSEMIWGCQWDAMMRFIGEERANATGYVSHESEYFKVKPYLTGETDYSTNYTKTEGEEGYVPYADIANNIYDLEGNIREWTQEANLSVSRVIRGGYFYHGLSPSHRGDSTPRSISSTIGSRLTLYIV